LRTLLKCGSKLLRGTHSAIGSRSRATPGFAIRTEGINSNFNTDAQGNHIQPPNASEQAVARSIWQRDGKWIAVSAPGGIYRRAKDSAQGDREPIPPEA
jgi:uncharacterized protein YdeI (BOF family)